VRDDVGLDARHLCGTLGRLVGERFEGNQDLGVAVVKVVGDLPRTE
jgi:hypothetical protein